MFKRISYILISIMLSCFPSALLAKGKAKKQGPLHSIEYVETVIAKAAKEVGVPFELLRAICRTESNLKVDAYVYNDGGSQNHAFGICQVLRTTAEKFVGVHKGCAQDFSGEYLPRTHKHCHLFHPHVNAMAAAKYLKHQIDRFDGDILKAVAAYNAGSVIMCGKSGWLMSNGKKIHRCKKNDLANRYYVDRVSKHLVSISLTRDPKTHRREKVFTIVKTS